LSAFIITLHIIACLVLIVLVLLQSGKEGMGVIFGGGSGSVFGSSGAGSLLVKLTSYVAAVFLITSLAYNYYSSAERRVSTSVMQNVNIEDIKPKAPAGENTAQTQAAPGAPAAPKDVPKPAVQFEDVKPGLPAPAPLGAAVPALPGAPDIATKQETAATPAAEVPAKVPAPEKPVAAPQK
jgi:preprotein translocase subunit SecG